MAAADVNLPYVFCVDKKSERKHGHNSVLCERTHGQNPVLCSMNTSSATESMLNRLQQQRQHKYLHQNILARISSELLPVITSLQ
jgi:hypothetical protein